MRHLLAVVLSLQASGLGAAVYSAPRDFAGEEACFDSSCAKPYALPVKMGFFKPEEVSPAPRNASVIAAATRKMLSPAFDVCSGAFISRSGYYLTALHCAEYCFRNSPKTSRPGFDYYDVGAEAALSSCESRFMIGNAWARLIVTGRGWDESTPVSLAVLNADSKLLDERKRLLTGDWAILKVELKEPASCLPAAGRPPSPGETIWGAGFPALTARTDDRGSDGKTLYFVTGKVAGRVMDTPRFRGINPDMIRYMTNFIGDALLSGDMILADADSYHKMSGGPFIDGAGRLAGIITDGYVDKPDKAGGLAHPSAVSGISVQAIRRSLSTRPELPAAKFFDCPAQ